MANAVYPKAKEQFSQAGINLLTSDIRFIVVDLADYVFSTAHEFLSDVPAISRVATMSAGVTGKTVTDGVFKCSNVLFTGISGDQSEAIIGYVHTGVEGTSRLVVFLDTSVTGLPITPDGGNIALNFNATGVYGL